MDAPESSGTVDSTGIITRVNDVPISLPTNSTSISLSTEDIERLQALILQQSSSLAELRSWTFNLPTWPDFSSASDRLYEQDIHRWANWTQQLMFAFNRQGQQLCNQLLPYL
jgi:hypothetical protein